MSNSPDTPSLKRDHDSFSFDSLGDLAKPFTADSQFVNPYESQLKEGSEDNSIITPLSVESKRARSPTMSRRSSTTSLSEAGSTTPPRDPSPTPSDSAASQQSVMKSAFSVMAASGPPAKKPKLTYAEKEMQMINQQIKDTELAEEMANKAVIDSGKAKKTSTRKLAQDTALREAEKAQKEAARLALAQEKAQREAEKAAEKAAKEVERMKKDAERAAQKAAKEESKRKRDEERKLKDEEKKLKEEERLRAEEEKKKKAGKQKSLTSFFQKPAPSPTKMSRVGDRNSMSPAPYASQSAPSPSALTPSKPARTLYNKRFPPFFVKAHVTLAPTNRFERDEQATDTLQNTLDSYILGNRSPNRPRSLDAVSLFHLSNQEKARGKLCIPVREIMAEYSGNSSKPVDLTIDSQNTQIRKTGNALKNVPLKFIKFMTDVRPPYIGTYTNRPVHGVMKLARNPLRRDLPDTNYDYDSEADWIEGDEDGEDIHSDIGDDDADLGDDMEDMEDFLDDENDELLNSKRLVMQGDLEPVSSGMCWEDRHKRSTNVKMMPYRMEIILGK